MKKSDSRCTQFKQCSKESRKNGLYLVATNRGGVGKGLSTKKNYCFWSFKINYVKDVVANKLEVGDKALMAGPLKKPFLAASLRQ